MKLRRSVLTVILLASAVFSQQPNTAQERSFPYSVAAVKAALTNLGAFQGARLPSMEGFVNTEGVPAQDFQRPYNEYKIDITSDSPSQTTVRVRANVTAWYNGSDPSTSGYRAFVSNGRLEADLVDRLTDYLKNKSSDPEVLTKRLAELKAERSATEQHIKGLERTLANAKTDPPHNAPVDYAVVTRHAQIVNSPSPAATVVLRPNAEDEFAILERRGQWLRVQLDDNRSGWLKAANTETATLKRAATPAAQPKTQDTAKFSVLRQTTSDFEGDWSRLKGKQALYVWAQPDGPVHESDRLQFAQNTFLQQYRLATHNSQNTVEGIVIIFMDQRGAVAAATLDDIRMWADGALTKSAFLKKCSLDPRAAFETPRSSRTRNVSPQPTGL